MGGSYSPSLAQQQAVPPLFVLCGNNVSGWTYCAVPRVRRTAAEMHCASETLWLTQRF